MIARVEGSIVEKNTDNIIVMVGGIGLKISCPQNVLTACEIGQTLRLRTQLIVREDLLALYGFENDTDSEYFSLLMGVSGIGPRLALGILSSVSTDVIRRAVVQDQPDFLSRVPGVGKKTAQKIVLHLQGRIKDTEGGGAFAFSPNVDFDVLEALTALGYSIAQAQAAVQTLPKDTADNIEEKLRIALQSLA